MNLTDYEKSLLDGAHGEAMQLAMRVLYDLGEYFGAERFVEIVACHDDSTVFLGEAQVVFAERLVRLGARFSVPTTTNACAVDMRRFDRQKHDIELMTATRRIEAAHLALGAIASWTCAPLPGGLCACLRATGGLCGIQCDRLCQLCRRGPHQPICRAAGTAGRDYGPGSLFRASHHPKSQGTGACQTGR
jgi:hypothetical protein